MRRAPSIVPAEWRTRRAADALARGMLERRVELAMILPPWPPERSPARLSSNSGAGDGVPLDVDLLRAELYRLLDAVVRAGTGQRDGLVAEFERAWAELKTLTGNPP